MNANKANAYFDIGAKIGYVNASLLDPVGVVQDYNPIIGDISTDKYEVIIKNGNCDWSVTMKIIKIFLASSIVKFKQDRLEIADCIRSLNDRYVEKGLYFKLFICEDESDAIATGRKQEEYDKEVCDSDYFYLIVGDSLGKYTEEEFNVAIEQFRKTGFPKIYTYFFRFNKEANSCTEFISRLRDELGHYYNIFSNIDSVKLHMLMELISDPNVAGKARVAFKNGNARIDDLPLISLENVPAYSNNAVLQEQRNKLQDLNIKFAGLAAEFGRTPQDISLLDQLTVCAKQRSEIEDSIFELEKSLFELLKFTADRSATKSWRREQAILEIEAGNYEGALNILRDARRIEELKNAESKIQIGEQITREAISEIVDYIEENTVRIRTLEYIGMNDERYSETEGLYEENMSLVLKHHLSLKYVFDYMKYLYEHNNVHKVLSVVEKVRKTYSDIQMIDRVNLARQEGSALVSLNLLSDAKDLFANVVSLVENNDVEDSLEALLYVDYGNVLFALNDFSEAEKYFLLGYRMLEACSTNNQETVDNILNVCANLGALYSDVNKRAEAMDYYYKAIQIAEELNDYSHLERKLLINAYNNLAVLKIQLNELQEANQYLDKALDIISEGEKSDMILYLSYRSMVSLNKGMLFHHLHSFDEAKKWLAQSLEIRNKLAIKDPKTFEPLLLNLYHNYGIVSATHGEFTDAKRYFDNSSALAQKLAAECSEVFLAFETIALITKTVIHPEYNNSIDLLMKCVEDSEKLVTLLSSAYHSYVGMSAYNLGVVSMKNNCIDYAIEMLTKSANEYERCNQFVGEINDATSYADIISDLKRAMDVVTNNLDVGEINTWYMEILEIVSGQIVGMAVRRRNN